VIEIAQREQFQSGFSYVGLNRIRIAPMWNGFVGCRSHGLQHFFFHRCKREKHMTLITQYERFKK
jgi:hypothetical protein